MPTNDDYRSAVVHLLREFSDKGLYDEFGDWCHSCGPSKLADLIEPTPVRTCRAIYDGDDSGHEFAGKSWHCSNCGHEMDEYEAKCGLYCIICGAAISL